jgi:hypothetical protein
VRFLPREHGAYGQLAFPLLTSYLVAGVSVPALLIGLAATTAFLAHEPFLVLVGRRGARSRREQGRPAARWLAITAGAALGCGVAAMWLMPPAVRWALLLPLAPAACVAAALILDREKSATGEIAVALTFSSLAVPVSVSAGASATVGAAVAIAYGALFVTATLGVRTIVLAVRGGGDPRAASIMRGATLLFGAAALVGVGIAVSRTPLPWPAAVAPVPGVVAAAAVALLARSARRLRTIGWLLISASLAAAAILLAGLRI